MSPHAKARRGANSKGGAYLKGALISFFNFRPRYDIVVIFRVPKLQYNNKTVITNYFLV